MDWRGGGWHVAKIAWIGLASRLHFSFVPSLTYRYGRSEVRLVLDTPRLAFTLCLTCFTREAAKTNDYQ